MQMPTMMFVVSGSANIIVPTKIAVIGSNTPSTDAFVAPILRVAIARVAGWCAHRIEEVSTAKKIIRPAYKCISKSKDYVSLEERI